MYRQELWIKMNAEYKDNNTWFECTITLPSRPVREEKISQTISLQFLSLTLLLVKNFNKIYYFALKFPSNLNFLQYWAQSIANFIEFYQLPQKVNFSFLARNVSKKRNFAILSENPNVPAIGGDHRKRIATALSSYEPVSIENNQSWTLKQERKVLQRQWNATWNGFFVMIHLIHKLNWNACSFEGWLKQN